jgi:hypothetical protein
VTFRVWAKRSGGEIGAIADDLLGTLADLVADERPLTRVRNRDRPILGGRSADRAER